MSSEQPSAAGAAALLYFLLAAAAWTVLVRVVPEGLPRAIAVLGLGFALIGAYVWLLLAQVRLILAGPERLRVHVLIAAAEVLAMLVAFGAVYQHLGIMDNSRAGSPIVNDFWTGVYYSVVTFTTLGYGDFYPKGIARALAGMQALTGYLVLAILASSAASVISPHDPAGRAEATAEGEGEERTQG